MKALTYFVMIWGIAAFLATPAFSEAQWIPEKPVSQLAIRPYRTFLNIRHYYVEDTGEAGSPIANVRIEITFPNGETVNLPEGGQYWPIGKGQVQEINRTFEIPFAYIKNHGFDFKVQMVRKGSPMLPCEFHVVQLEDHNTGYVCKVDMNWQTAQGIPENQLDKEGIQARVFTDRNSPKKEIPTNAIALR